MAPACNSILQGRTSIFGSKFFFNILFNKNLSTDLQFFEIFLHKIGIFIVRKKGDNEMLAFSCKSGLLINSCQKTALLLKTFRVQYLALNNNKTLSN